MDTGRRDFLKILGLGSVGAALPAALLPSAPAFAQGEDITANSVNLGNDRLSLDWRRGTTGWVVERVRVRGRAGWRELSGVTGEYRLLTSTTAPSAGDAATKPVGDEVRCYPERAWRTPDGIAFQAALPAGTLTAQWALDPTASDVVVTLTFAPAVTAYYSLMSPALAAVAPDELRRGVIPGYWTGTAIQSREDLGYRYGIGVPASPLVARERTATTATTLVETTGGITLGVVAAPGTARDPWESDTSTHSRWQLGLSTVDRRGELLPTAHHPVLGQAGSLVAAGQALQFSFRYLLREGDWFDAFKHVVYDVYDLRSYLRLARNKRSLVNRLAVMQDFVAGPSSRWHVWTFKGLELGAESDKLSDVGAMWMMRALTGDPVIEHERLPYARNFKLAQQETEPGPFQGAALGEYYSARDGRWVSENYRANTAPFNQDYVSPIFTTFYTLADVGNILLFQPDDTELRDRLRLAADKLLSWQHPDGSFDIGYLRADPTVKIYPEVPDLRATWYGLLVAYRTLGDARYLDGARRGADWLIANAVATGSFIGVCDDVRLVRDFQVVFAAQALLELGEATGERRYVNAAIEAARLYTTHVYTHPTPSTDSRVFHGEEMPQWRTSQAGLGFEHAGFTGSANGAGPILLCCHTGAFVRFHQLTGEKLFLDMARTAARGRDAFVDQSRGIPSYYWSAGPGGAGVFPWHGWWHMGWMIDYLLAEARLRSHDRITFPRGYMTAKVGASAPYGFADGSVYGQAARLWQPAGLVDTGDPNVEHLTALATNGKRLFLMLVNGSPERIETTVRLDPRALSPGQRATWGAWQVLAGRVDATDGGWHVQLKGEDLAVLAIDVDLADDPLGPRPRTFAIGGELLAPTLSWAYWTQTTSWVEWRVAGAPEWTATPEAQGYRFSATLDLSTVATPAAVEIRVATRSTSGAIGYSEPISRQVYRVGANLALRAPATASSTYNTTYSPDKAVDGDRTSTSSRWLSAVGDARPTLTVTLPSVTIPKLARINSGPDDSQRLADFTVQALVGDEWVTVGSVVENTQRSVDVLLEPRETRQLRLSISRPSRDPVNVARVFEFELYDELH
ncbi:discoidin domain-containing protein [Micromonospora yasonensis]|uniref:discoidin domain-containing protein n=1 Tax=Micromonospora yasonensis TaxID=1128667 RepID=UPI0022310A66|nr:discoidin domain-containing protein [Micromonospora yasonensis]MCW3843810.1 discoidin domain-containing protein [Micromonospora yasonensis]